MRSHHPRRSLLVTASILILAVVAGLGWVAWQARPLNEPVGFSQPSVLVAPAPSGGRVAPSEAALPPTIRAAGPALPAGARSLRLTLRDERRPMRFEVGPVPPASPIRVVCGTCPGNLVEWTF